MEANIDHKQILEMTELNLADRSTGIPYSKIKFPDSQVSLKISNEWKEEPKEVVINSRMNNYEDVFYIISAADALRSKGVSDVHLFISCFLTQRSDREFIPGHSFDMWEMCEIIKQQEFKSITVFHPHSDVLPALLKTRTNRVLIRDNTPFIERAIAEIEAIEGSKVKLISPDAGAFKWVFKLAEKVKRDVVSGNKSRNLETNEVTTEFHVDMTGQVCLIVDDYCDGGRTFTQLAAKLREHNASKVYLYTSHGLYSNGLQDLAVNINGLFTTNSINDESHDSFLTRFKII